jgi:hypothetical protein
MTGFLFRRCAVSDTKNQRKRELECLRLASDLAQLARDTLNPDLRAHCVRMAKLWSDQADWGSLGNSSVQSVLYH